MNNIPFAFDTRIPRRSLLAIAAKQGIEIMGGLNYMRARGTAVTDFQSREFKTQKQNKTNIHTHKNMDDY